MKNKIILIGLLIWNFNSVFGQICGTSHSTAPTIYPQQDTNLRAKGSSSALYINVFFHIVRNTDGTNAFTTPNTDNIVRELNKFYSSHNITINNLGKNFINNSSYINTSEKEHKILMNSGYDVPNAINYYIVENLWNVYRNGVYQGYVTGVVDDIPSNSLVIRNDRVLRLTSPHEFGHCLSLLHTHETARGVEAINRSNCKTAGDLVCDTPADNRKGNLGGYSPDLTNIMSYYNNRDHFTNGQGYRMRYATNNESVLQGIRKIFYPKLTGSSTIYNTSTATYTLKNNPPTATVTWSVSYNLKIISSTNTNVRIRHKSGTNTGRASVSATINNGKKVTVKNDDFT